MTRFEAHRDIPVVALRAYGVRTVRSVRTCIDRSDGRSGCVAAVVVPPALIRQVIRHRWKAFPYSESIRQTVGDLCEVDLGPEATDHTAKISRIGRVAVIGAIDVSHRELIDSRIRHRFRATPTRIRVVTARPGGTLWTHAADVIGNSGGRIEIVARASTVRKSRLGWEFGGVVCRRGDSRAADPRVEDRERRSLFHLGQSLHEPASRIVAPVVATLWHRPERVVIGVEADPELLEVVLALRARLLRVPFARRAVTAR